MGRLQNLPGLALRRARSQLLMAAAPFAAQAALVSYPKSGRTWLQFILSNYLNAVFGLGLDVDLSSMFALIPNYAGDVQRGVGAWRKVGKPKRVPLVLVSHLPYSRARFLRLPVLFMVRNPHDVMVSSYFHRTRHRHQFSGEIGAFLRDARYGLRPFIDFHNAWSQALPGHRSMVLSYEDLAADPLGASERAVAFLGLEVNRSGLEQAVHASSFERMRALESRTPVPNHAYDLADRDSLRIRRGKVGGYQADLQPRDVAWIEATCKAGLIPAARELLRATGWEQDREDAGQSPHDPDGCGARERFRLADGMPGTAP